MALEQSFSAASASHWTSTACQGPKPYLRSSGTDFLSPCVVSFMVGFEDEGRLTSVHAAYAAKQQLHQNTVEFLWPFDQEQNTWEIYHLNQCIRLIVFHLLYVNCTMHYMQGAFFKTSAIIIASWKTSAEMSLVSVLSINSVILSL